MRERGNVWKALVPGKQAVDIIFRFRKGKKEQTQTHYGNINIVEGNVCLSEILHRM